MSDEPAECPLCMEVLEIDDHSFFPCTCGYQICRFCWHRIRTDENGLCPACRKQYPEDPAEFKPLTEDELQNIKKERKQKDVQRKQKAAENRKHLANVRVVQRNLVFVVGLSPRLADPEVLKKHEYFGKFGKIHKVVINQSTSYAGSQGPSASAYVTYVKPEDALRAILTVNNIHVDGRTLKTSLGTTKYCSHFLKGSHCQKNDCMYLHELGEEAASFTKDEMQAGKHQEYEQMLVEQFLNTQNSTNSHHVITNNKLKKNISQQVVENTDVIPSLMDMTGDIKHSGHPHPGPLLPNPGSGTINANGISTASHSAWPLLESSSSPAPGGGISRESKSDQPVINNSTRTQNGKSSHRSNTPPGSGGGSSYSASSNPVGTGRQKASSSTNGVEENHISSQASSVSSSNLSSSPEQLDSIEVPQASPTSLLQQQQQELSSATVRGLPLPTPVSQSLASPRAGTSLPSVPSTGVTPVTTTLNGVPPQQTLLSPEPSPEHNAANSMVSAIGSNRRSLMSEPSNNPGLSFFSNSSNSGLLNACNSSVKPDTINPTPDLPNLSLSPHELSDSLPITSDTDWSAAFGFKSKDLSQDDDLGFDPCAESFKGLADLMEKENGWMMENGGMHAQHNSLHSPQQSRLNGSPPHSNSFLPPHLSTSPLQTNTHLPTLSRLPPGFSMSHIQQQQQQLQQLYRPDLASSKMLDYLNPHFGQPTATHQRFSTLQNYHSMPLDLHTQHQQPQQQLPQRDAYSMKDMQEQLRSMLPNINISFGASVPPLQQQQQQQQQSQQQQQPQQQLSSSLHVPQQNQVLNKSWPLSNSPDTSSPWNDPAIVSTSHLSEHADSAPHWLKSLQQLTETDGPSSHTRLPFVQQFPMAGAGGWPHTLNPPPGFRMNGMPAQQNPETTHQMAEVLQ